MVKTIVDVLHGMEFKGCNDFMQVIHKNGFAKGMDFSDFYRQQLFGKGHRSVVSSNYLNHGLSGLRGLHGLSGQQIVALKHS